MKRFDGKAMAIVGFEVDQVRRTPEGDVSVPINVAYNHHFESNMIGKASRLKKVKLSGPDDPLIAAHKLHMGHGLPSDKETWVVEQMEETNTQGIPSAQAFGAANGGEYRMSYHGEKCCSL